MLKYYSGLFGTLSPEILILILCNFTLEQVMAFRCSCKWANDFFLLHQRALIRKVSENTVSSAAENLYHGSLCPNLINIARRCSISEDIAHVLVQCQSIGCGLYYNIFGLRKRSTSYVANFTKRVCPYILALIEFFEEYRYRLANFVPDSDNTQTPSDDVEVLLLARYNEQPVNRLCVLYHTVVELLHFHVPQAEPISMFKLLGITRANYPPSELADGEHLDFLTFGGLEVFKDVFTKGSGKFKGQFAEDVMVAHFARVTPISLPVTYDAGRVHTTFMPLTRSIQPQMNDPNNVTATRVCLLLPRAAAFLRNGYSENALVEERHKFMRYLRASELTDVVEEIELSG